MRSALSRRANQDVLKLDPGISPPTIGVGAYEIRKELSQAWKTRLPVGFYSSTLKLRKNMHPVDFYSSAIKLERNIFRVGFYSSTGKLRQFMLCVDFYCSTGKLGKKYVDFLLQYRGAWKNMFRVDFCSSTVKL